MNLVNQKTPGNHRKMERRVNLLIILYISLITQVKSETIESTTKTDNLEVDSSQCHTCFTSNNEVVNTENFVDNVIDVLYNLTVKGAVVNKTIDNLELEVDNLLERAISKDRYEIFDGFEIEPIKDAKIKRKDNESDDKKSIEESEGRALFSKYTYEYRLLQKVKDFVNTHVLSIDLPKAAKFMGFRSFGINKFLLPLFIGGQVLIKSVLLAMFLPSILGSFGKILGKGISQLSASSSQASYPPINNGEDQTAYNNENKEPMGYETNPAGAYAYPDAYNDPGDVNELGNVDMSRFGVPGQHIPTKNSYYQNQMQPSNNYKVFQKIPASSMILSNYDPFYSPLLSRLDGIFARLGLAPQENAVDDSPQIGGQSIHDVRLESCREQLICLMYSSPAKYAPYSNLISAQLSRLSTLWVIYLSCAIGVLVRDFEHVVRDVLQIGRQSIHDVRLESCKEQLICLMYSSPAKYAPYSNLISAQLSRELNELRRPVSDNPEILRFFRYMRAARRGQEGTDCMRAFPTCASNAAPAHTMIAAYHDINKLVTARKLGNT